MSQPRRKTFSQTGAQIRVPVESERDLVSARYLRTPLYGGNPPARRVAGRLNVERKPFAERYEASLRRYLDDPEETRRSHAYDIGRRALAADLGILDLAAAHCAALANIVHAHGRHGAASSVIRPAGDFFAECLSPFEMSHRGAREGVRAWRRLNEALENEAKRIAHALHDEAGQLLASLHIALADLAADLPRGRRTRLEKVKRLLARIESELRSVSHELRPTVLDRLGLKPALQFLAENVARRAGIAIAVRGEDPGRLPPVVEITLYRVAQEALNNVVRHARASNASIELQVAAKCVTCTVRDDGVGFAAELPAAGEGLGLLIIGERLTALGGALRFTSRPGRGTALRAEIPRAG